MRTRKRFLMVFEYELQEAYLLHMTNQVADAVEHTVMDLLVIGIKLKLMLLVPSHGWLKW